MKTAIAAAQKTLTAAGEVKAGGQAVDLNAISTNDCVLMTTVTNSANVQKQGTTITLYYAFANADTSANISRLAPAGTIKVTIPTVASDIRIATTDKITVRGRWIHLWYDHDDLSATAALDVSVVW